MLPVVLNSCQIMQDSVNALLRNIRRPKEGTFNAINKKFILHNEVDYLHREPSNVNVVKIRRLQKA